MNTTEPRFTPLWTCTWCGDPIRLKPVPCPGGCGVRQHVGCSSRFAGCPTPGCDGRAYTTPAPVPLPPSPLERDEPDPRAQWPLIAGVIAAVLALISFVSVVAPVVGLGYFLLYGDWEFPDFSN